MSSDSSSQSIHVQLQNCRIEHLLSCYFAGRWLITFNLRVKTNIPNPIPSKQMNNQIFYDQVQNKFRSAFWSLQPLCDLSNGRHITRSTTW